MPPDSEMLPDGAKRVQPTPVRYFVVAFAILAAVLMYVDRFCVSFAERYIKEELRLSDTEMAWFISIFFWSYALGQVPGGWLGDRFGSRRVLAGYVLTWSLFTALTGLAGGILSLLVMRLGCGLAQAGAYPVCGTLLSHWAPLASRGIFSASVALGGRIGGVLAPLLTAYLMVQFVPASSPSLLQMRDLLNPDSLASRLAIPPPPSTRADSKPGDTQAGSPSTTAVRRFYALFSAERIATPQAANANELLAALNRTLRHAEIYDAAAFHDVRLPGEARALIQKQVREQALQPDDRVRLNRLLLESIFPDEIRKRHGQAWRSVLILYGLVGVFVAVGFYWYVRDSPARHAGCNQAELEIIEFGRRPENIAASPAALPWRALLRSRSLWCCSVSQFCTNIGWLFLVTWLARYLAEIHHVPFLERGWMIAVPACAGIVGMFCGGYLTDAMTRRFGRRWGRALPMSLTRVGAAVAYLAAMWLPTPWAVTIALAIVFFFVDLGLSSIWAFCQDVGGKQVGSVLGWGNMWGNLGAALAPHLYNGILGERPSFVEWNLMLSGCAVMMVAAAVSAFCVDASIPIAADARPDDIRAGSP